MRHHPVDEKAPALSLVPVVTRRSRRRRLTFLLGAIGIALLAAGGTQGAAREKPRAAAIWEATPLGPVERRPTSPPRAAGPYRSPRRGPSEARGPRSARSRSP